MSKHAKASAVKLFKSIDRTRIEACWFITNTLPREFDCPIDEFKRILERYFARLTRAFGDRLAWYWCVEPTKAGQWHLHMIALWVKDAPVQRERWLKFREWNDLAWHASTRVPDKAHLRAGCRIEAAKSWAGVTCYLSGYLSPEKWSHYEGPDTGRVHGLRNGALLPINVDEHDLSPRAVCLLRRAIARVRSRRASGMFFLDVASGKRSRVHVEFNRDVAKKVARLHVGRGETIRFKRVRARYFRNEVEWEDEYLTLPDGRQKHLGVRAARVDHWGKAVPSYAFGPSELHLDWKQVRRLIEWAIREDRRRSEIENSLPF